MSRSPMADTETAEAPARREPGATRERRFVYSGQGAGGGQNEYLTRGNKPVKRRRKSPFKIVMLIATISILIVFYVWNKITVNRLDAEIGKLVEKQLVLEANIKHYGAEIDRKSQLDRIEDLATKKLGMIHNPEQPLFFTIENYRATSKESGRQ